MLTHIIVWIKNIHSWRTFIYIAISAQKESELLAKTFWKDSKVVHKNQNINQKVAHETLLDPHFSYNWY